MYRASAVEERERRVYVRCYIFLGSCPERIRDFARLASLPSRAACIFRGRFAVAGLQGGIPWGRASSRGCKRAGNNQVTAPGLLGLALP